RTVRDQIEREGTDRDQHLATLNDRVGRGAQQIESLANKIEMKRVDFEVTKNHSHELAAGISLGITSTDLLHRRASGWMWVTSDRRTIWLRGQGAQEPVIFYGYRDGKRRELVITGVTRDSVAGYLLLPTD